MSNKKPKFDIDFRKEYPSLKQNVNGVDIDLTAEEYEATIAQWEINQAEAKLAYEAELKLEKDKSAILDRIGLTADELKTILG
jgi:hypothetical protein